MTLEEKLKSDLRIEEAKFKFLEKEISKNNIYAQLLYDLCAVKIKEIEFQLEISNIQIPKNILMKAIEAFDDNTYLALAWFDKVNMLLQHKTPRECLKDKDGCHTVLNLLNTIIHNNFS